MPRTSRQRPRQRLPWTALTVACLLASAQLTPATAGSRGKASFERTIRRAERALARGDYPAAGEAARKVLAAGVAPEPLRGRALTVLGKVLFFNNRAPHSAEESEEDRRSREQGLELAERALRDAVALGGSSGAEAGLYLADLLFSRGMVADGRRALDAYLDAVPPEERNRRAEHLEECRAFMAALEAGSPLYNIVADEPVVEVPKTVRSAPPQYTEAARKARLEGPSSVQVIIDREGEVVCVTPRTGLPLGLLEAMIETFHDWRFEPALLEGEPVPASFNLTTFFRISDR